MINGIAIILLVIVCCVVAYIAFATGYESGKIVGYKIEENRAKVAAQYEAEYLNAKGIADAIDSENPNIY